MLTIVRHMGAYLATIGRFVLLARVVYGCQDQSVAAQLRADERRLIGELDEDHTCYVVASVNGVPFRMLVDTGSSDLGFNRSHLRRLGLNGRRLIFNEFVDTSNGKVRSASIIVHELRLGTFVLHNVQASVDDTEKADPVLGMSVIRYMHLEIGRDGCELRW
jgi:clan AA aspartic protease (TIGR02281 family)